MNIFKMAVTLIFASIFFSASAYAESQKLADKLSGAALMFNVQVKSCNADAAILCPGLPLNSKKSFMCLMAYEDNLSTACAIGIVEAAISMEVAALAIDYSIKSCEADADKYCGKVEAGEGRIVSCLKKNEAKLAKQCSSALKETGLWNLGTK